MRFRVSAYEDGVKKSRVIEAKDREEAKQIGLEIFYADTIYVSEEE